MISLLILFILWLGACYYTKVYLSEENKRHHAEGHEVDEKDGGEGLEVLGCHQYSITQHTHAAVEFEHLDEFDRSCENHSRQKEAKGFVPHGDRDKIHIVICIENIVLHRSI